jgi:hypothetical protein
LCIVLTVQYAGLSVVEIDQTGLRWIIFKKCFVRPHNLCVFMEPLTNAVSKIDDSLQPGGM